VKIHDAAPDLARAAGQNKGPAAAYKSSQDLTAYELRFRPTTCTHTAHVRLTGSPRTLGSPNLGPRSERTGKKTERSGTK
jgi:hypothetical protein